MRWDREIHLHLHSTMVPTQTNQGGGGQSGYCISWRDGPTFTTIWTHLHALSGIKKRMAWCCCVFPRHSLAQTLPCSSCPQLRVIWLAVIAYHNQIVCIIILKLSFNSKNCLNGLYFIFFRVEVHKWLFLSGFYDRLYNKGIKVIKIYYFHLI